MFVVEVEDKKKENIDRENHFSANTKLDIELDEGNNGNNDVEMPNGIF